MFALTGKRAGTAKWHGNETVITALPDMSKVRSAKLQKEKQKIFANSVGYARTLNEDPTRKAIDVKR